MSLYISSRQHKQLDTSPHCDNPVLIVPPLLRLQHRFFEAEYSFKNLLVDSYELANPQTQVISYPVLPCGELQIFILFGNTHRSACLCGPVSRLKKLCIPRKSTVYCARFRAGSIGLFTQQEASELTDLAVPLTRFPDCFPRHIQYAESFHERNVMLGRQLAELDAERYAPLPLVTSSIEKITERQGRIKVAELAQAGACSERYINRIFHTWIGLPPKCFCELTQLHFTMHMMMRQKSKSLMQTAVACGYYDHAHMNRAFRKFLGYTADDMRHTDVNQLNLWSIPSIWEAI